MSDQIFRTTPVPNYQTCLYTLSIRGGNGLAELVSYTFPISPQSIRKDRRALSNIYDTQGSALNQGVSRQVDSYGLTPPMYVIEGTTGWQKHSSDGMSLTGLQSIQQLQQLLAQYAALSQAQQAITQIATNGVSLPTSILGYNSVPGLSSIGGAIANYFVPDGSAQATGQSIGASIAAQAAQIVLEFYVYFSDEYWVVEPIGPQTIRQSADRPLLTYYRFQWAAIRPVGNAIFGAIDALAALTDVPALSSLASLGNTLNSGLSLYGLSGRAY
jgi:hypothetical protein